MKDDMKEAVNDYYAGLKNKINGDDYQGDDTDQALAKICISEGILDGEGEFEHAHYKGVIDIGQNPEIRVDAYCPEELSSKGILKVMVADGRLDENDPEPLPIGAVYMPFIDHARDFVKHCTENSSFADQIMDKNGEASTLASKIHEAWEAEKITSIHIILVSTGILNNSESELDGVDHKSIEDVPVTFRVVDISRLQDLDLTGVDVNLDLHQFNDSIKAVRVDAVKEGTQIYTSYVGYIGGELLYNLYKKWSNRILEGNVRTFLEFGGLRSTNSGIKDTLMKYPENFFAYNNGLTCTAQDIEYDEEKGEITALKNLQIVNGAQTTGSIYNAKVEEGSSVDLTRVRVQIKITEIQIIDPDFLLNVSRYSNTQNKLNVSDFDSNLPYHEALEMLSRKVTIGTDKKYGWFYERARGSYKQQQMDQFRSGGNNAKTEFTDRFPKKIIKDDLAKTIQAFNGKPWMVCKGASENFREFSENLKEYWENSDTAYFEMSNSHGETINHFICDQEANDHTEINEHYFKEIVAKQIIFTELGSQISKHMKGWYEQQRGIRAALIAYSIAYLNHRLMEHGQCINFDRVWNEQSVPRPLMSMLLELAESMATPDDPLYIVSMEEGKDSGRWNAMIEGVNAVERWATLKELADTGVGPYLQSIDDYYRSRRTAKVTARKSYEERINKRLNDMTGRARLWSRVEDWIERQPESDKYYMDEVLLTKARTPGIELDSDESMNLYQMYQSMVKKGMSNFHIDMNDLLMHYKEDDKKEKDTETLEGSSR